MLMPTSCQTLKTAEKIAKSPISWYTGFRKDKGCNFEVSSFWKALKRNVYDIITVHESATMQNH